MLRSLAAPLALTSVLACGGATATPSSADGGGTSSGSSGGGSSSSGSSGGASSSSGSSGGASSSSSSSGASSSSGSSSGGSSDGGAPACTLQACGSGCCAGTYCWAFSDVCLQNGTCPAAGIDTPMSGLCTCDGLPAGACPAGEICPTGAHGHATFCMPDDGGAGDAGLGGLGAPCTADSECAGGLCLGGAFVAGYCTEAVSECDPGLCSNASLSCEGYGGFQDIDGSALGTAEICPQLCTTVGDCRSGYGCCATNAGGGGKACLPTAMCP